MRKLRRRILLFSGASGFRDKGFLVSAPPHITIIADKRGHKKVHLFFQSYLRLSAFIRGFSLRDDKVY
jgi:hypothetical protein